MRWGGFCVGPRRFRYFPGSSSRSGLLRRITQKTQATASAIKRTRTPIETNATRPLKIAAVITSARQMRVKITNTVMKAIYPLLLSFWFNVPFFSVGIFLIVSKILTGRLRQPSIVNSIFMAVVLSLVVIAFVRRPVLGLNRANQFF